MTPNVDSLLCFFWTYTWTARSLHRSGLVRVKLQNKELDSAIGVISPLWDWGKGIYLYMHITYKYTRMFMCFIADDAKHDEYPS